MSAYIARMFSSVSGTCSTSQPSRIARRTALRPRECKDLSRAFSSMSVSSTAVESLGWISKDFTSPLRAITPAA